MKKVLVLYKSKTGFSQRYGEWIAEGLGCECRSIKGVKLDDLKDYGLIVYGAGIYAGTISGAGKIKNWIEKAPNKTWVVFATGATPAKEGYAELIFNSNFRKGEVRPAHFYYFLSGINYEKMGVFDRLLMFFFSKMDSRKREKAAPAKATSIDLSNRMYIDDLLRYVRLKAR